MSRLLKIKMTKSKRAWLKITKRQLYCSMLFYELIVVGFICFPPSVKLINRIEPHILGLPCFQFFILLSAVLIVLGLIIWYVLENQIDMQQNFNDQRCFDELQSLDGQHKMKVDGETYGT